GNLMSNIPEITTQTLFGPTGLNISLPGVANISIGGPPRMIGGAADSKPVQTATLTAAAVDVVSVQLLQGTVRLADVRVGHMENATAVPAGGITCGIGLVKKSDKDVVTPGQDFTWTVSVSNPNDCVLQQVKVVDSITADTPIVWTVDNATPAADQKANSGVTWNDVGPLNPGDSKDLTIHVIVSPSSGGGKFLDNAVATGVCGPAAGTAGAGAAVGVPLEAKVSLSLPEVNAALGALLPRELPRTGGALAVLPALALTGGGLALRRSRRRKRERRSRVSVRHASEGGARRAPPSLRRCAVLCGPHPRRPAEGLVGGGAVVGHVPEQRPPDHRQPGDDEARHDHRHVAVPGGDAEAGEEGVVERPHGADPEHEGEERAESGQGRDRAVDEVDDLDDGEGQQ